MPQSISHNKTSEQRQCADTRSSSFASCSSSSTAVYQAPTSSYYTMERSSSQYSFSSRHPSSPTSIPSSPSSPIEQGFFGAISQKIRGRSRSRSANGVRRNRSKSPLPPAQLSPTHSTPTSPRPTQHRQSSSSSHGCTKRQSLPTHMKRQSTDSSQASNPWYGRHSNSWLFNDFSVTEHVSDAYHKLKRRDT